MKSLIPALVALFFGALVLRAQPAVELYLAEEELPDLVQCLPAPPDTIGEAFTHDIMRYMWGKTQRLDPERLAVAKLDAVWDLDTLRTIYSVPFGMEISPEKTPEIYRAFVNGVSTIEQIRFRPKAHYFRMRPYARFKEESIFPQDDAWLATEGSYPSGHTIRAWSASRAATGRATWTPAPRPPASATPACRRASPTGSRSHSPGKNSAAWPQTAGRRQMPVKMLPSGNRRSCFSRSECSRSYSTW